MARFPSPATLSSMGSGEASDSSVGLQESAAHEAGHVLIAGLEGSEVEWARAKRSGSGKTKIKDQDALEPRTQARVAVAGAVAEEVLLGGEQRSLPPNDARLLELALGSLDDPGIDEVVIRDEVRAAVNQHQAGAVSIAELLERRANSSVPGDELAAAREAAEREG